jgi:hypothetical protein
MLRSTRLPALVLFLSGQLAAQDDTASLQSLLDKGGSVALEARTYRVSSTLLLDLSRSGITSIHGHGATRILHSGPGPALQIQGSLASNADPKNVAPTVLDKERLPLVHGIEILGQHPESDGIRASGTMQLTIGSITIRNCRHGIHLTHRNRNLLITACHIYHNTGIGIFYDQVNLHQSNISASHISYCAGGGIVSRGGEVRNLHIGTCDIEANQSTTTPPTANIVLDSTHGSVAEVAITGCTIQHSSKATDSANIRIIGSGTDPNLEGKAVRQATREGHITITGNVFSDAQFNLDVCNARGITVTGNTFWEGFQADLRLTDSQNIIVANNNFDRNPRYVVNGFANAENNGVLISNCTDSSFTGNIVSGVYRQPAAVALTHCERMRITDNSILDSDGHGLLLQDTSHSIITGNLIRDDRAPDLRSKGLSIKVQGGNANLIEHNLLGAP